MEGKSRTWENAEKQIFGEESAREQGLWEENAGE